MVDGTGPRGAPGRTRLVAELPREETLANRVVAELERLIGESRLGEGDRLPSERELAAQFGVSRTVVREAVRALTARRLVEVGGGRGTVVRAPSTQAAAESMRLLLRVQESAGDADKVAEVRRVLENEIASLAAARRTPDDLAALMAILHAAEDHVDEPDAFVEEDVEFYAVLARATHNELFSIILDSLAQVMLEVRLLALRIPGTTRRSLTHHRAVYDAVAAGHPADARAAMNDHMDEARETLQRAIAADQGADCGRPPPGYDVGAIIVDETTSSNSDRLTRAAERSSSNWGAGSVRHPGELPAARHETPRSLHRTRDPPSVEACAEIDRYASPPDRSSSETITSNGAVTPVQSSNPAAP